MNIWCLQSNFVDCGSSLESNSPGILALCETSLYDSIDCDNSSVRGYFPLIWKDSATHIYGLIVYVKENLPFAWDLSLEKCRLLLMFLTGFTSLSVLLLFLVLITFFFSMYSFWFYSSDIDEVLSINQSANVFVFGDLKSIIRTD